LFLSRYLPPLLLQSLLLLLLLLLTLPLGLARPLQELCRCRCRRPFPMRVCHGCRQLLQLW
jgi:hypothetical protein